MQQRVLTQWVIIAGVIAWAAGAAAQENASDRSPAHEADEDEQPFARVTLHELHPPRDEPIASPDDAIADGFGRLLLAPRGADGELAQTVVAVYEHGSEVEVYSTRTIGQIAHHDVPPGRYDVRFDFGGLVGGLRKDDVLVEPGRDVVVELGGPRMLGRLSVEITDALGDPARRMVAILHAGTGRELVRQLSAADGTLELNARPGEYRISIAHAVPMTSNVIEVRPGMGTHVITGGYGRLAVEVNDAAGEPAQVHVHVLRASKLERVSSRLVDGEAAFDLPPGEYDVQFGFEPGVMRENVLVRAGEITTIVVRPDLAEHNQASGVVLIAGAIGIAVVVILVTMLLKRAGLKKQI